MLRNLSNCQQSGDYAQMRVVQAMLSVAGTAMPLPPYRPRNPSGGGSLMDLLGAEEHRRSSNRRCSVCSCEMQLHQQQ